MRKVARGPVYPVTNEYAFGTIKTYATSITGNESLATGTINGNVNAGSKTLFEEVLQDQFEWEYLQHQIPEGLEQKQEMGIMGIWN